VDDFTERGEGQALPLQQQFDALKHGCGGIVRRRQLLVDGEPVTTPDQSEIRKRSTDIDADPMHAR
jgi:hypothetical protein